MEHEPFVDVIIQAMVERIVNGAMLLLIVFVVACQDAQELPTLAPTMVAVQLPTSAPSVDLATDTPAPPTVTLTPSVTPVVLTPQPTPLVGPGVNITSPSIDSEILLGEEVVTSGLVQLGPDHEFSLFLESASGHVLDQAQPEISDFGSWQATITVPHSISGRAEIRARLATDAGQIVAEDSVPVMLQVDQESVDRYLVLYRPQESEQPVAGYNVFFDGLAQRPVDNLVTISLWTDDCQNRVARQSFRLRGSGYWQGFVIVPFETEGLICAVAHFGEPDNETYREAQIELDVRPASDEHALGVLVGNPPPEKDLRAGSSLLLYGTAYNAPGREVLVSILLENGRLLTEGIAAVNTYGYWELELFIPASAAGPAQIEASVGKHGDDNFAQSIIPIHIGAR
jgi:hypothetical protein